MICNASQTVAKPVLREAQSRLTYSSITEGDRIFLDFL